VTLLVTDNAGATNSVSHDVTVSDPAPPPAATLTLVSTSKVKSNWTVKFSWSGFGAGVNSVTVYRNNAAIATVPVAPNSYTDGGKGGGTFTYKVCDAANANTCTNTVTASP
jgi:hypothetical protein